MSFGCHFNKSYRDIFLNNLISRCCCFFNSEKKQGQQANTEKGKLKVHCDCYELEFCFENVKKCNSIMPHTYREV